MYGVELLGRGFIRVCLCISGERHIMCMLFRRKVLEKFITCMLVDQRI